MTEDEFNYYMQFVEQIDSGNFDVSDKDAKFIESMFGRKSKRLSPAQAKWIRDMVWRYLGERIK